MKKITQFLIPLGLGLAAFAMNWMAVQPQLGRDFVVASGTIEIDQPLKESNLARFKIVGEDFSRLKQTLVPWEERAALLGLPVQRALQTGDFVFWQDVRYAAADFLTAPDEIPLHVSLEGVDYEAGLLKVGNQVGLIVPIIAETPSPSAGSPANPPAGVTTNATAPAGAALYEEIGPFRILSVGMRTEAAPNEDSKTAVSRGNVRIVTLAMKTDAASAPPAGAAATVTDARPLPAAAQKLLRAQNLRRSDGKSIVAMVLYQDVAKLRRLREAAAAADAAAVPKASSSATATPSATGTNQP